MRRRLASVLTVLLTVLLPLVPAWPAAGAHVGPSGPLAAAAATAVPHPALDLHADDGCTPVCAAPCGHARTSFAPGPVPVSPGRASHDSGRAPPVSSGT